MWPHSALPVSPRRYQQLELQPPSPGAGGATIGAAYNTTDSPLDDAWVDTTTLAVPPAIPMYQPSASPGARWHGLCSPPTGSACCGQQCRHALRRLLWPAVQACPERALMRRSLENSDARVVVQAASQAAATSCPGAWRSCGWQTARLECSGKAAAACHNLPPPTTCQDRPPAP